MSVTVRIWRYIAGVIRPAPYDVSAALITAVEANDLKRVEDLLARGASVTATRDSKFVRNFTVLMVASEIGNPEVVKILIDKGAKVNAKSWGIANYTPLLVTILHNHADATRLLLAKGADPMECDHDDLSPLMLAASLARLDIVRALLDFGADVNFSRRPSWTPLTLAIYGESHPQREAVVQLLIHGGADVGPVVATLTGKGNPYRHEAEELLRKATNDLYP